MLHNVSRLEVKPLGRRATRGVAAIEGASRHAAAMLAYRTGTCLTAPNGHVFDFSRRSNVFVRDIVLPPDAPAWLVDAAANDDFQAIADAVERVATRRDGRLFREFQPTIDRRIPKARQEPLLRALGEELASLGMVAVVAGHHDVASDGGDQDHGHLTTVPWRPSADGFAGQDPIWDSPTLVRHFRRRWCELQNVELRAIGIPEQELTDHRSHADRGIDAIPQVKEGPARPARRRGRPAPNPERCPVRINQAIAEVNAGKEDVAQREAALEAGRAVLEARRSALDAREVDLGSREAAAAQATQEASQRVQEAEKRVTEEITLRQQVEAEIERLRADSAREANTLRRQLERVGDAGLPELEACVDRWSQVTKLVVHDRKIAPAQPLPADQAEAFAADFKGRYELGGVVIARNSARAQVTTVTKDLEAARASIARTSDELESKDLVLFELKQVLAGEQQGHSEAKQQLATTALNNQELTADLTAEQKRAAAAEQKTEHYRKLLAITKAAAVLDNKETGQARYAMSVIVRVVERVMPWLATILHRHFKPTIKPAIPEAIQREIEEALRGRQQPLVIEAAPVATPSPLTEGRAPTADEMDTFRRATADQANLRRATDWLAYGGRNTTVLIGRLDDGRPVARCVDGSDVDHDEIQRWFDRYQADQRILHPPAPAAQDTMDVGKERGARGPSRDKPRTM